MVKKTEPAKPPRRPPAEAPGHLSERAKALWRCLVPRHAKTPERLTFLQAALEALDRAEAARRAVEAEGMTTTTKTTGAVHLHPLLKVESESRRQFATLWERLDLHRDPIFDDAINRAIRDMGPYQPAEREA